MCDTETSFSITQTSLRALGILKFCLAAGPRTYIVSLLNGVV